MVNEPTSLALSELACQIPNYKSKIVELAKSNNKDTLYAKFVEKFLAYLPVDYNAVDKLPLFEQFASEAFEFFKQGTEQSLKVKIYNKDLGNIPAISIITLIQNKPNIVDSISCLFLRLGLRAKYVLHPVISCVRDKNNNLEKILDISADNTSESLLFMKVIGNFDKDALHNLECEITKTLDQVDDIHHSWNKVIENITNISENIKLISASYLQNKVHIQENLDFLEWIKNDNFIFLGSLNFSLPQINVTFEEGASSIWQNNVEEIKNIIDFSASELNQDQIIILGKINCLSPIDPNNLIDFILVKQINAQGQYDAGQMIFGLYSSNINYQSIKNIPLLKGKLQYVLDKANFSANGYNSKKLSIIIESLPRAALIQIAEGDLYCMSIHMLSSMMSKKLKVFIQQDWSKSFVNVLIFLPRERLTPAVHNSINKYLAQEFGGKQLSDCITEVAQNFSYLFTSFEIKGAVNLSLTKIEQDLDKLSILWIESFCDKYLEKFGELITDLQLRQYGDIFSDDYRHKFSTTEALSDLEYILAANTQDKIGFNLESKDDTEFQLKIYSAKKKLALSDLLPAIENLGFKALDEQTFSIKGNDDIEDSWLYQFILTTPQKISINFNILKNNVEEALDKMMLGLLANDSLSKLIVLSGLNWRQIKLLKALTRYMHQTGFVYGKGYVQLVLIKHHKYTELLEEFFDAKFNPKNYSQQNVEAVKQAITVYLDNVTNSAEDKVLGQMYNLIDAVVRTNFYQSAQGSLKNYLSFKFDSDKIIDLPRPVPYAEIYVFSNDFEAIHLRGGKVARGGIRWSDRGEDYRTEVLGLMKAQMSKNPVIVPVGCKGGFFPLFSQDSMTRQEYMTKIVACYQNFLRGILDITDNIIDGKIIQPENTIIYDDQDPYLVVAADKGTASFSDYANDISKEYNFWLKDAFASGGSLGYDHKKMGITAKGAWISVQRHFQEFGIDVQQEPITVVGIGDMSGDVFGNGLLSSQTIKLVAAFNHMHIFIDPNPDPLLSYNERLRLSNLPNSKWSDYDSKILSQGGGIFERTAKSIDLNLEIKKLLDLEVNELSPEELIRAILKAKVDLIWNGGIGTYIKASFENHTDIGDKTNDLLRCNGKDIRASVIAEGGNLGVSQQGRIEYSRYGGHINTDFIDNSAGVDCSDHEVNIKIALNQAVVLKQITQEERNEILIKMTSQVEQLVLSDNYQQTQAITIACLSSSSTVEAATQLIKFLEQEKLLDRAIEFLPDDAELNRRSIAKETMSRPELAVLLSYSKMSVYNEIIKTDLSQDKYFESLLIEYFPQIMQERFRDVILNHPLRKEIINTVITNNIINQLGGTLINTLRRETNATLRDIISAYYAIKKIFDLDNLWCQVESLSSQINNNIKVEMFTELAKLMRRGIAWFVKNLNNPVNITVIINEFDKKAQDLSIIIKTLLVGEAKAKFDDKCARYLAAGVNNEFAKSIATLDSLISVFDIIYVAKHHVVEANKVAGIYFDIGNILGIDWLRRACDKQTHDSYWNRLSIQSLKDDLYDKQRRLLAKIISKPLNNLTLEEWINNNLGAAQIFIDFIAIIKLYENIDLDIIILANKKFEIFLRKLD